MYNNTVLEGAGELCSVVIWGPVGRHLDTSVFLLARLVHSRESRRAGAPTHGGGMGVLRVKYPNPHADGLY